MKKMILLAFFLLTTLSISAQEQDRFVYELHFEIAQNASVLDAEKMFFIFYDGFKQSEKCTNVTALQHHTGAGFQYKILAYANSWDDLDDMSVQAQTYFSANYPEMMTSAWPMVHTGDAIYAVRTSFEQGFISQ
jgi:hypothetical protein